MENQTGTNSGTGSGKTALVTGATSGIGRELATLFAKDGYNLVLIARSDEDLIRVADSYEHQFGISVVPIQKDLSNENAAQEIYDETQQRGLTIDVLVNNAGVGEYGKFASETDLQKELNLIRTNVSSLVGLTKFYLRDMVQRNEGKILMLGSIASVMPNPFMAVYGATKSFIYSFSEALRNEVKDTNVTITVLMPGATDTDFFNKAGAMNTKAQELARETPAADVAKTGYDALMSGKDKVVHGLSNKAQVAMAHFLPDPTVANAARQQMMDKNEAEAESQHTQSIALSIGVAALAVAGLFVLNAWNNRSPLEQAYDKARFRFKANRLKNRAQSGLEDLKETVLNAVN